MNDDDVGLSCYAQPALQQCKICREDRRQLKQLTTCGHAFCTDCILRWCQESCRHLDETTVSCPQCRQVTKLPNGTANQLRTKFAGLLRCLDCDNMKPLDDHWWCRCCSTVICSKCALLNHRQEQLDAYEQFDALQASFRWLKRRCQDDKDGLLWSQSTLQRMMNAICATVVDGLKLRNRSGLKTMQAMRSLFNQCGVEEADTDDEDAVDSAKPTIRLVIKQLFQLAGVETSEDLCEEMQKDPCELFIQDLKTAVNQLTVADFKRAERMTAQQDFSHRHWPASMRQTYASIVCDRIARPVDICALPDDHVLVADAESGLLLFDAHLHYVRGLTDPHVRSVCYDANKALLVVAVPIEQKAKFYDVDDLSFKFQCDMPPANLWVRIRCTDNGVLFCASYDASTCSVQVHCCSNEKEWHTFAILHDLVRQFFSFTLLPVSDKLSDFAKLLLVTDTGHMYEITVEKAAGTMLKNTRSINLDGVTLTAPTAVTATSEGNILLADDGRFYEIDAQYKYIRTVGSAGPKAMATGLLIRREPDTLCTTITNRRCVALFPLNC